jgi:hypothetical protein
MSRPSKPPPVAESASQHRSERVCDFLERKLPPGMTDQAPFLTEALLEASARYDRYAASKKDWFSYVRRRERLLKVARLARQLASEFCELDILSRDDLGSRIDPEQVDSLIGSLHLLRTGIMELAEGVQKDGKPRDLAEERWILELADIYENTFSRPAGVWGSGTGPKKQRGTFYQLLEVGRPMSFPRYGKLSPRQVERILKRRRGRNPTAITLDEVIELEVIDNPPSRPELS